MIEIKLDDRNRSIVQCCDPQIQLKAPPTNQFHQNELKVNKQFVYVYPTYLVSLREDSTLNILTQIHQLKQSSKDILKSVHNRTFTTKSST